MSPWMIRWEIFAVFAVSLGASALNALLSLIGSLLAPAPLSGQEALLVGSQAQNHWLDLTLQLASVAEGLTPVVLVFYLLARSDESPSLLGIDASQPGKDAARGAALAAAIGGIGLGLYYAAFHLHVALNVVPEQLPSVWWRVPVLALFAFQNGMLEETLVLGYLLTRLDQLGTKPGVAVSISAMLRGSYHLYQGLGGFLGNMAMGVVFGVLFRRWRRATPMIIAHTLIDGVAFIGYSYLHGHVSWLP